MDTHQEKAFASESIAIIIPCYNEGSVIATTVEPLIQSGYTVVVVNDGSSDNSKEILHSLPVFALTHAVNLGQGAALQTGVEFALRLPQVQVIVHFDADGQHSHQEIGDMVEPIQRGQVDVVLGSRFLSSARLSVPLKKRILLRGARLVNYLFTGLSLSDAHNGFRAMSRQAASKIRMTEPGFTHASEILWLIRKSQLRFREFPTHIRYTEYSMAKGQSVLNSLNILWDLILLKLIK